MAQGVYNVTVHVYTSLSPAQKLKADRVGRVYRPNSNKPLVAGDYLGLTMGHGDRRPVPKNPMSFLNLSKIPSIIHNFLLL